MNRGPKLSRKMTAGSTTSIGTASTASTDDGFELDEDEAKRWEAKLIFSRFGQPQVGQPQVGQNQVGQNQVGQNLVGGQSMDLEALEEDSGHLKTNSKSEYESQC
jgi:hypothetical protein